MTLLRPLDAVVAWVVNFVSVQSVSIVAFALGITLASAPGWAVAGVIRIGAVVVVISWLWLIRGVRLEELRGLFPTSRRSIAVGAFLGMALSTVEYLIVVAVHLIDRTPNLVDGTRNPWVATRSLADTSFVFAVVFVIVGPVVEEFIHRGVAYPGLRSRLRIPAAAILSSVVFALGHDWTVFDFASAFAFGLVAVWLVERYRSLSPAIAAHVVSNLVVVIVGWSLYNLFGIPGTIVG
ncbi:MAG: type II CAAX endopeptidase family protein [Acidimicrobiia bacterium]